MVLVDTSVLIDFLKEKNCKPVQKFQSILNHKIPFGITQVIYQEILQGSIDEKEFNKLKIYLESQHFYNLLHGDISYEEAARIYMKCRKSGFTPRSTIDLIIVQVARENNLQLLHNDKDFDKIAKIVNLRLY